ncbi:MAG: zinc-ribbon domain-containing protein, partial [Myxococcaceae bacterium]|nr:zinc-ribbon domain-containing protein [Myxococcaceae bacterium]
MKVSCPSCKTQLNIDDGKIPPGGARIKCPTCQNIFPFKATAPVSAAVPLPGSSAKGGAANSGAVPLPGASSQPAPSAEENEWDSMPTRAVKLPSDIAKMLAAEKAEKEKVPGATTSVAPPSNAPVPLPAPVPKAFNQTMAAFPPMHDLETDFSEVDNSNVRTTTMQVPDFAKSAPDFAAAGLPVPTTHGQGSGSVPLPGASTDDFAVDDGGGWNNSEAGHSPDLGGAVPLPGSGGEAYPPPSAGHDAYSDNAYGNDAYAAGGAVPLPGSAASGYTAADEFPQGNDGSVPLPGASDPYGESNGGDTSGAVPLPGQSEANPFAGGFGTDTGDAVPLPGQSSGDFAPASSSMFGQADLSGGDAVPFSDDAVPLPGAQGAPDSAEPEMRTRAVDTSALQGLFSKPAAPAEPTAAPAAQAGGLFEAPASEIDFGQEQDDSARTRAVTVPPDLFGSEPLPPAPPPSNLFDDANLPSPKGEEPPMAFDFSAPAPPAPPAAASEAIPDFSDLPMPAGDNLPMPAMGGNLPSPADAAGTSDTLAPGGFNIDFGAPPSAPEPVAPSMPAFNPSVSFGDVNLNTGGAPDHLEFDPAAVPAAPAKDPFEADFSSPSSSSSAAPAPKADGLEMLNFIDDAAKSGEFATRRFHVKRRSGKTFGPFDEGVIIKMLEDGQLMGNEEISLDEETWQPIGAEAVFQPAIAKLLEAPPKVAPSAPTLGEPTAKQAESMERLKNVYEGRMAAVAVVQQREPFDFKKRLPLMGVGLAVLLILGFGAYLGTTPVGFFGMKKLFPARVKPGTKEFAELQTAQAGFLTDTYESYKQARTKSEYALSIKEYPEARAVWCQAIFYLGRKFAAATPQDLSKAKAELENINLLGEKHVEVVKAHAGNLLSQKKPAEALAMLNEAIAFTENQGDLELAFLRAEAFTAQAKYKEASGDLNRVLEKKKDSARALHELGNLARLQKDIDTAATQYAAALKADPNHVISSVELAALEVHEKKEADKALAMIEVALEKDKRKALGPTELARALSIKGDALAAQGKLADAEGAFKEALEADKASPIAKAGMAQLLLNRGEFEKAVPFFKEAAEAAPNSLETVDGYLSSLIGAGKMEDALKVVQSASTRFPGNARLAYLNARVDDALDHVPEAQRNYLAAVAADPTMVDANLGLARLYIRFRRFSEARPQLQAAVERAPNNPLVQVGLADMALADGDLDKAEAGYKKASEIDANLPEPYLGLSAVALKREQYEQADNLIEKALKLNVRVPGGRLQHGRTLWKLGKLAEAVEELQSARQAEPRNSEIAVTLGAVQMEKKDLQGATATLTAVLQAEPTHPEG